MKKTTIRTQKTALVLTAFIILVLCAAGVYWAGKHCTMDWERGVLTVTEDPWSGYSYEVHNDHVELLKYTGDKEKVRVPDRLVGKPVTVIKEVCFMMKRELKTVHLGRNIQTIEKGAFSECVSLEHVTGDAELEVITESTFSACLRLQTVDVGNRIKRIEDYAFVRCLELESIGEQPELEYIGEAAFEETGSIPGFRVPEGTEVGNRAFSDSKWLGNWLEENRTEEFVILGAGTLVAYHGDAETVEIPYGVTRVDWNTFTYSEGVRDIKEIYLPETVAEVESWAFDGCGKIRVYMPESVTALDTLNLSVKLVTDDETSELTGKEGKLTIVTTSGSYAEEYAKEYGVEYEIVEPWW